MFFPRFLSSETKDDFPETMKRFKLPVGGAFGVSDIAGVPHLHALGKYHENHFPIRDPVHEGTRHNEGSSTP